MHTTAIQSALPLEHMEEHTSYIPEGRGDCMACSAKWPVSERDICHFQAIALTCCSVCSPLSSLSTEIMESPRVFMVKLELSGYSREDWDLGELFRLSSDPVIETQKC